MSNRKIANLLNNGHASTQLVHWELAWVRPKLASASSSYKVRKWVQKKKVVGGGGGAAGGGGKENSGQQGTSESNALSRSVTPAGTTPQSRSREDTAEPNQHQHQSKKQHPLANSVFPSAATSEAGGAEEGEAEDGEEEEEDDDDGDDNDTPLVNQSERGGEDEEDDVQMDDQP